MKISVVIPSYNRGHVLKWTIPTYIQDNVIEIIVVDDCSTDNTPQVLSELSVEYPMIKYLRNEENRRQCYSKNRGVENAVGDFVYFGDDDSYLLPGSMKVLSDTMTKYNCDVVMARPIFAGPNFRWKYRKQYEKWRLNRMDKSNYDGPFDIETMTPHWDRQYPIPMEVPVCHACTLVKKELAQACKFDENYIGCAYREETDFFFRLNLHFGAKMMFDSRACQMNLPNYMVKSGGSRRGG